MVQRNPDQVCNRCKHTHNRNMSIPIYDPRSRNNKKRYIPAYSKELNPSFVSSKGAVDEQCYQWELEGKRGNGKQPEIIYPENFETVYLLVRNDKSLRPIEGIEKVFFNTNPEAIEALLSDPLRSIRVYPLTLYKLLIAENPRNRHNSLFAVLSSEQVRR